VRDNERVNVRTAGVVSMAAMALCFVQGANAQACDARPQTSEATPQQVIDFFAAQRWKVVSFFGYSGAEYDHPAAMLKRAGRVLDGLNTKRTVVNIGATEQGIGAVYALAKRRVSRPRASSPAWPRRRVWRCRLASTKCSS
jgi:hypothetical protein